MRGESQLIADDRGIFIVPVVITHCPIPPSNTHLHSSPGQSSLVIVGLIVVLSVLVLVELLCITAYYQSHTAFFTGGLRGRAKN